MDLSPSREAASCADTHEFPNILLKPKVHYRFHKSPSLVPILSRISPVHTTPSYISKISFNIVGYRPVAKRPLCKQPPFLGNGLVNKLPRQRIRMQQESYCWKTGVSM
jgi:hypothetical protein